MGDTCPNCSSKTPDFSDVKSCLQALEKIEATGSALFRGESCLFPKTSPGTVRVLEDVSLSFEEKTFLIDAVEMFKEWFNDHQYNDVDSCDMFLQHYGLPTDLLDFTESAKIATYFAVKDKPEHIGRVGVMPLNPDTHMALDIIPFSRFSLDGLVLERPQKQRARAVRHRTGDPIDFQDKDVCKLLGIRWLTFRKDCRDEKLFADMKDIIDSTHDPFANEMRRWLAEFSASTWHSEKVKKAMIDRVNRYL